MAPASSVSWHLAPPLGGRPWWPTMKEAGSGGVSTNKLAAGADRVNAGAFSFFLGHHGGGREEVDGVASWPDAASSSSTPTSAGGVRRSSPPSLDGLLQGIKARSRRDSFNKLVGWPVLLRGLEIWRCSRSFLSISSAESSVEPCCSSPLLIFLVEWRPYGDQAPRVVALLQILRRPLSYSSWQPCRKGGSSSFCVASYVGAVPSGFVPGGGSTGFVVKLHVGVSRRWWWTRLFFSFPVQGPFYKMQGLGCISLFLEVPCVICKATA